MTFFLKFQFLSFYSVIKKIFHIMVCAFCLTFFILYDYLEGLCFYSCGYFVIYNYTNMVVLTLIRAMINENIWITSPPASHTHFWFYNVYWFLTIKYTYSLSDSFCLPAIKSEDISMHTHSLSPFLLFLSLILHYFFIVRIYDIDILWQSLSLLF